MRWSTGRRWRLAVLAFVGVATSLGRADEGMWTFDNPPLALLQQRCGFTPPPGWLDHLRLSSVRFNDGGSGSFISTTGLVLTNHHVALDQLQKLSTAERNYVRDGFYAARRVDQDRGQRQRTVIVAKSVSAAVMNRCSSLSLVRARAASKALEALSKSRSAKKSVARPSGIRYAV